MKRERALYWGTFVTSDPWHLVCCNIDRANSMAEQQLAVGDGGGKFKAVFELVLHVWYIGQF